MNSWNKKHFVGKETDIAQCALKCCNILIGVMEKNWFWKKLVIPMFFYLHCGRGFICLYGGQTNRCLISWALCDNSGNTLGQHKTPCHTLHICIWHFASCPLLNTHDIGVSSDCGQASAYYDLYQVFRCW